MKYAYTVLQYHSILFHLSPFLKGAAGFIVSVNRILTKDLISDVQVNTLYFFLISITIVLACYLTHRAMEKSEFVRFYIGKCEKIKNTFGMQGGRRRGSTEEAQRKQQQRQKEEEEVFMTAF